MDTPNTDLQGAPGSFQQGLVTRVKNILLTPAAEWDVIDKEPAEIGGLYKNYILILAAIGPLATLIHGLAFGFSALGITYRPSIGSAVVSAITSYALALIGVFVLAMVIDALAPSFGATKNRIQAFKVAAYAGTASWVAGIFGLIPGLGFLTILGLYSLYLLYLGLPRLMKAPQDKALGYTVVTVIAAVALTLLAGAIAAPVATLFAGKSAIPTMDSGSLSGSLNIPGVGSVDASKIEEFGKQAEAAAKQMETGQSNAVPAASLEAILPATLGGMARSKLSSGSAGVGGIGGSNAEAIYESGESRITLSVTDMSAAGAIAGLGGLLNVESNETTSTGYERTGNVDGRMTSEKWQSTDKSGSYSTIFDNRFMVEARGSGTDMDTLKAAVAGIDAEKLESLTK
jgi:Yip1 domain